MLMKLTIGRRIELTPLGSHVNLACDVEESITGTFTPDKQSNENLTRTTTVGSQYSLNNNHNNNSQTDGKFNFLNTVMRLL